MDRAEELYGAMVLRGFRGEFPHAAALPWRWRDTVFMLLCAGGLGLFRAFDLAELLGRVLL